MVLSDAQVQRLREIEIDGHITPDIVFAEAANRTSVLHVLIDWDRDRAAHAKWMEDCREICRSYCLVIRDEHETYRVTGYVRDPDVEPSAQGYVSMERLRKDPAYAKRSLMLEFDRAVALLVRARDHAKALGLEEEVETLLKRVQQLLSEVKKLQPAA